MLICMNILQTQRTPVSIILLDTNISVKGHSTYITDLNLQDVTISALRNFGATEMTQWVSVAVLPEDQG